MAEAPERMNLNLAVAAAEAATGAAHMLLAAWRNEHEPNMGDVMIALCDALACAVRMGGRPEDAGLLAAVEAWFDAHDNPVGGENLL